MPACPQFENLEQVQLPQRPVHLAIGMFDGVHLGHRAVIEAAIQSARRANGLAGVLTFSPHPSALFRPESRTRMITTDAERSRLLAATGLDFIITQQFTPAFAQIEAEVFLSTLRKALPKLSAVYVGENWRFGRGRKGDIHLLHTEARQLRLSVFSAPRVNHNGEPISSTRIRACLETGAMEEANALLGYSYCASGVISGGKALGRTIGFPTLNLDWQPDLQPKLGVYAVRIRGAKSTAPLPGVANYGLRPTVEDALKPRLEIHALDECPYGSGDEVTIDWLAYLRPEQKFPGLDALKAQIAQDRDQALRYFQEQES